MKRVVVTGANGFIGRPLCEQLAGRGWNVVAVVRPGAAFPELGFALVPLALAIAGSRVVLGLHYPTDVLVGALLGASTGAAGAALI